MSTRSFQTANKSLSAEVDPDKPMAQIRLGKEGREISVRDLRAFARWVMAATEPVRRRS